MPKGRMKRNNLSAGLPSLDSQALRETESERRSGMEKTAIFGMNPLAPSFDSF
jgi:hypothetical protein